MKIVVGHKAPDTDSVCSAIVYSKIIRAEPRVMSGINEETSYALKKFGAETPKTWNGEGEQIILVDHNEANQSVGNYDRVIEVIDHHKAGIETIIPIRIEMEPVGSTCTIIARKIKTPDRKTAGLLLSGILSDTVVFKSPTTTREDIRVAKGLAGIAGVKPEEYGVELKKSGMNFKNMTPKDLVMKDYKEYTLSGKKFFVGQVEVADLKEILKLKKELLREMKGMNYDCALLMLTDIIKEVTELLVVGEEVEISKVFGKVENNSVTLPKVLSRKKQIVPQITKHFS